MESLTTPRCALQFSAKSRAFYGRVIPSEAPFSGVEGPAFVFLPASAADAQATPASSPAFPSLPVPSFPWSLVPWSLFPGLCSLFPVPCSLLSCSLAPSLPAFSFPRSLGPCFLPHPPTPHPLPPVFLVLQSLSPDVPKSLLLPHPPIVSAPHPPCRFVKL